MNVQTLRRLAILVVAGLGSMALTACNTLEGAGRDVERAGEKVQDMARD